VPALACASRYALAMPSLSALELFAIAALALIVIPGPAVLYIVSQSVGHGRKSGLAAVAGVELGAFVHVAGAALGVSAIIASSATAFSVLKLAGGAYLIVLGIKRLRERDPGPGEDGVPARVRPLKATFRQGMIVSALNPKTALFFLAFLPQFVDPERGHAALQAAVLGVLFVAIATLSDSVWALGSGSFATLLRASARARRVERYASGGILVGLGVLATFAHPARRT
jgi:threonine/homoserine/homoserine lactone efflux protein